MDTKAIEKFYEEQGIVGLFGMAKTKDGNYVQLDFGYGQIEKAGALKSLEVITNYHMDKQVRTVFAQKEAMDAKQQQQPAPTSPGTEVTQ